MKLMGLIISVAILSWIDTTPLHAAERGEYRLGIQAGHVGLLDEVGDGAGNAIGFGGRFGYYFEDDLELEAQFITSSHTDLRHTETAVGINYLVSNYDAALLYLGAGASYLTNKLTALNDLSGNAFGLYLGAGAEFEISKALSLGLQARYQEAFDTEDTDVDNNEVKTVQDSVTLMVRLSFRLGGRDKSQSVY